jgi:hypothetical protein
MLVVHKVRPLSLFSNWGANCILSSLAQVVRVESECENQYSKSLRKSDLLGSVNAMNYWRPAKILCFPIGWTAKGACSKGSVENFLGRRRLLSHPEEERTWRKSRFV